MATTTETVEVKFTADTQEYDESVEKSNEGTSNFSASIGSVVSGTIAAGAALLKFNFVMKLFNIQTLLGIENVALFNVTMGSLARTIYTKLIPAFVRLRIAIFATGIGALVIILVSLFAILKNTVTGSDLLSTAMKALGNIVQGLIDLWTGLAKAIFGLLTGDWELATNGLAQAWDGVANGIGNAWANAAGYVGVLRQIIQFEETLATRRQRAQADLIDINTELARLPEFSAQLAGLLEDQYDAQLKLNGLKKQQLALELASLTSDKLTEESRKRINEIQAELLALQKEEADQKEQLGLDQEEARALASGKRRQDESIRLATETASLVQGIAVSSADGTNAILIGNNQLTNDAKLEQDKDYLAKKKAAEDASAVLQRKANHDELALQLETANAFAGQGLDLAAQLADGDRELQGKLMIAKAVGQTAVNINKMFPNPVLMVAAALTGATQIAAIASSMKVAPEQVEVVDTPIQAAERGNIESARINTNDGIQVQQSQPVLVVDDYVKASNRIQVVSDRGTL